MSAAKPIAASVRMLAVVAVLAAAPRELPAATSDGVDDAREALGSRWRFPWYDGDEDALRRVKVRTPWEWNFNNPSGPRWSWDWLKVVFLIVGSLLLAGLAYLLIKLYLAREDRSPGEQTGLGKLGESGDTARIEALPFRLRTGALDLLGEARRHYAAGNYGEAVIYLFSHELVALDRGQAIRLAKGKTNRQYLRELARRPALAELLGQTMVAFEDVFFGGHSLSRQRFEACWFRLDEFDAALGEGRPV